MTSILPWLLLFVASHVSQAQIQNMMIGAFTDTRLNKDLQLDVIHRAIIDIGIEGKSPSFHPVLVGLEIDKDDDQKIISDKICRFVTDGVAVILGPLFYHPHEEILQSTSEIHGIPFFKLHFDFQHVSSTNLNSFVFEFAPSYSDLNNATISYIRDDQFNWKRVQVLFDPEAGIEGLQEFIDEASVQNWQLNLVPIPTDGMGTPRWEMKTGLKLTEAKDAGERYFMLHCKFSIANQILLLALERGMLSAEYHYLLTAPVGSIFDGMLEGVTFDRRIAGAESKIYILSSKINGTRFKERLDKVIEPFDSAEVQNAKAMLAAQYDAMWAYAKAVAAAKLNNEELDIMTSRRRICNQAREEGERIDLNRRVKDQIKRVVFDGVTGLVKFNNENSKTAWLNITLLNKNTTRWIMSQHGEIDTWPRDSNMRTTFIRGSTLRVIAVVEKPFVIRNTNPEELQEFGGLCVDLIENLAKRFGFSIIIREAKDKAYGIDTTGKGSWTGVIKELNDGDADIAIGAFPITSKRAQIVDFTEAFMSSEAVAVARIKTQKQADVLAFLRPFHIHVWMAIAFAFVTIGLVMFFINQLDPNEWRLTARQKDKADEIRTLGALNITNSIWYTASSILNQGSEINPRSMAGRALAGIWGLFGVIILGYYTANLTAFLTVTQSSQEIDSIDQLSKQADLPYGILNNSALVDFLKYGQVPTYERLWLGISSNKKSGLLKTEEEGIRKAQSEKFVHIGDRKIVEYYLQDKPCDMTIIGSALWKYGLGVVLGKNSPLTENMTNFILEMRERGEVDKLREKWFTKNQTCKNAATSKAAKKPSRVTKPIDFENISGVMFVLLGGMCLAIFTGVLECVYNSYSNYCQKRKMAAKGRNGRTKTTANQVSLDNLTRHDSHSTWV
ncbi:glutamate receptor ionotropic, kainate 2-like [Tubulanus polymorphus]|uniref:glutamate receptor ionotropic, kainate 2-like n=1 Tax=Tubulanus polymorphus TaxID=672921 RepID=UPI003DA32BDC